MPKDRSRFSAAAQRPQAQVSDRHQVDDMDSSTPHATSKTDSRAAAAIAAAATTSTPDELGPLPPGWQLSKTDNERDFFIDHINKRTTWVRQKQSRSEEFLRFSHQIDPRTGKPSPMPAAQRELNQNGPLPVSQSVTRELNRHLLNSPSHNGKFEHYLMVVFITSIIVRADRRLLGVLICWLF